MTKSATIIGGSMAGLFAANALIKKGWDVSIHEKVPGFPLEQLFIDDPDGVKVELNYATSD